MSAAIISFVGFITLALILQYLKQRKWHFSYSEAVLIDNAKVFSGNDVQKVIDNCFVIAAKYF